eukprot:1505908-Pyramimonas_sp.AAC.1
MVLVGEEGARPSDAEAPTRTCTRRLAHTPVATLPRPLAHRRALLGAPAVGGAAEKGKTKSMGRHEATE